MNRRYIKCTQLYLLLFVSNAAECFSVFIFTHQQHVLRDCIVHHFNKYMTRYSPTTTTTLLISRRADYAIFSPELQRNKSMSVLQVVVVAVDL